ncbi:hypothetical protein GGS21DRAFT_377330 [Xylaria nigripes]|nr:hypothetical protein GGS21DRAFT_377330 [Xylaria nigripes]
MHLTSVITFTTLLIGTTMSAPTELQRIYFNCDTSQASGFSPKCCTDINGQIGVNCKPALHTHCLYMISRHKGVAAHIMGATNPIYECNLFVYNITGCCQSTGYKNPSTDYTIDLCAMNINTL